jgi:SAM-dependent methyltransferase
VEPDPLGKPARDQGDIRAAARLPLPVSRAGARRRQLTDPRPLPFAFGNLAETYDRVRPRYFAPLVDRAQEALELTAQARVLDLGAGTGRLTRELARRFATVIAIEPDEEMRGLIDVATVLAGSAESIPLENASIDGVFVGEAFHWFDATRAIAEIARVLVPRGGLAIVSTHWWETEPPLPDEVMEILREPYQRFAAQRRAPWDDAFADAPFEPLQREKFDEALVVDTERLLTMYSTTSSLAALPQEEREALFDRVRPLLAGPYRLPVEHELTWTRLPSV